MTRALVLIALLATAVPATAQPLAPGDSLLAAEVFRELIEIPSVSSTPATVEAAEAMAARLRSAG